jgi:hypothetical protein
VSQTSGDPEPTTAPRHLSRRHAQHGTFTLTPRSIDGTAPVKRNRYIKLTGATKSGPGDQNPRPGRAQGLCRCWGYADRRRVLPGGGRAGSGFIGIITDS